MRNDEITIAEATRLLGFSSRDYLYRLLEAGTIAGEKDGRVWRVSRESVELYRQRNQEVGR